MRFYWGFLKKTRKTWLILLQFLQNKLYFLRFFKESSKKPHLWKPSKTSNFEAGMRTEFFKMRLNLWGLLMLKRLRFFEAKPQKNSNFLMRLRLAFSRFLPTLVKSKLPGLYHLRYPINSFNILSFEIEGIRSATDKTLVWQTRGREIKSQYQWGRKCHVREGRQLEEKSVGKGGCVVEGRLWMGTLLNNVQFYILFSPNLKIIFIILIFFVYVINLTIVSHRFLEIMMVNLRIMHM